MRSPGLLALLLLILALDFAVPYEPTTRGWYEFDEEECVHPEPRRLEQPRATDEEPASTPVAAAASRPAPAAPGAVRRYSAPVTRLARADTSSPPAPADAH